MRRNQQTFFALFISSISFITSSYSQQSVVAAGGTGVGTGGSSNYSIGQIAYTGLSGSNGSVLQGVQQAYEIITLGNDEFTGIKLMMTAYPNPTTDILNLIVVNDKQNDLSYNLYDINGKIVSKKSKITTSETSISMQELNQGIYFLSVSDNNKAIKTFKIIKK